MSARSSEVKSNVETEESKVTAEQGELFPTHEFLDPVTCEIMQDPVVARDGFTYERSSIEQWFRMGKRISIKTGAPLNDTTLTPNRTLKTTIQDFMEKLPKIQREQVEARRLQKLTEENLVAAINETIKDHETLKSSYQTVQAELKALKSSQSSEIDSSGLGTIPQVESAVEINERKIFAETFDFKKAYELFKIGLPKINTAKNKSLVLVLGNKGSGKTTTIHSLLGYKMKEAEKDGQFVIEVEGIPYSEIGHGETAQTLYPQALSNSESTLTFCDIPGFHDNRTREERVCASLGTQHAIQSAARIESILVVVKYAELSASTGADRGEAFTKLLDTLNELLVNVTQLTPSIHFIVTAADPRLTEAHIVKTISSRLQESILKLIGSKIDYSAFRFMGMEKSPVAEEFKRFIKKMAALELLKTIEQSKNITIIRPLETDSASKNRIMKWLSRPEKMAIKSDSFNFTDYDVVRGAFERCVDDIMQNAIFLFTKQSSLESNITQRQIRLGLSELTDPSEIKRLEEQQKIEVEKLKERINAQMKEFAKYREFYSTRSLWKMIVNLFIYKKVLRFEQTICGDIERFGNLQELEDATKKLSEIEQNIQSCMGTYLFVADLLSVIGSTSPLSTEFAKFMGVPMKDVPSEKKRSDEAKRSTHIHEPESKGDSKSSTDQRTLTWQSSMSLGSSDNGGSAGAASEPRRTSRERKGS